MLLTAVTNIVLVFNRILIRLILRNRMYISLDVQVTGIMNEEV